MKPRPLTKRPRRKTGPSSWGCAPPWKHTTSIIAQFYDVENPAGVPRTYRDRLDYATEAATLLKWTNPHSEVAVRDLRTNERMVIQLPKSASTVVKMPDPGGTNQGTQKPKGPLLV